MKQFQHTSVFHFSPEALMRFHRSPGAFQRLSMPPLVTRIDRDGRRSLTEGELAFTLWIGPVPIPWTARHEPGPIETSFRDVQVAGPMASWEHEHIFISHPQGARMVDRIVYAHHPGWRGWMTRLFFDGPALRLLFVYRHWQTRRWLEQKSQRTADPAGPHHSPAIPGKLGAKTPKN